MIERCFCVFLAFFYVGAAEAGLFFRPEVTEHIRTIMPPTPFDVDARLRDNVSFWVRIYGEYKSNQGLIHDARHIDRIYEILEFQPGEDPEDKIRESKKRWKAALLSLHRKFGGAKGAHRKVASAWNGSEPELTSDEAHVFRLFHDINEPDKYIQATARKRMRFQGGQKDRFEQGLRESGRYLSLMEEIFRREGLPLELTRLPFVESSFNTHARSKVGASGVWQFMRSTGRFFLRINDAVDERNDPIRATEAAARLLRLNYETLGKWPLAVTAYNHGRHGMMRAVQKTGSEELEDLVDTYRSRSFGFASMNFFAELLAAVEVERNSEKYFGKIEREKPRHFFEVNIPDFIQIQDLVSFMSLELEAVRELNPGLNESVFEGTKLIPSGYQLRLPLGAQLAPEEAKRSFLSSYERIPASNKLKAQRPGKYAKRFPRGR